MNKIIVWLTYNLAPLNGSRRKLYSSQIRQILCHISEQISKLLCKVRNPVPTKPTMIQSLWIRVFLIYMHIYYLFLMYLIIYRVFPMSLAILLITRTHLVRLRTISPKAVIRGSVSLCPNVIAKCVQDTAFKKLQ